MPAEAQRALRREAGDREQVVGLLPDAEGVEALDLRVHDGRRLEALERIAAGLADPRRLVLEPRLARRHVARLRGAHVVAEELERLPAAPRELVVVPHRDERPARPRVLQVGILEVRAIERPVVVERRRDVEAPDLLAVGVADDVAQPPVVAAPVGALLGVVDHLVDEVAEMQHEGELLVGRRALVLVDHAPVGVLRALAHVLAAHEREPHRPRVVRERRRARAADAAARAALAHEAVPVGLRPAADPRRARGRCGRPRRARACAPRRRRARRRGPRRPRRVSGTMGASPPDGRARPEQHAVGMGIARGDALREEVAPLAPALARAPRALSPQASVAPIAVAAATNSRRVTRRLMLYGVFDAGNILRST